jgi:hypothetical protein
MDLDFKKISKAWFDSYFGTKDQKELAQQRSSICEVCPSRKVITEKLSLATICGECGCPIKKKVFSTTYNDCPLKKWKEIDDNSKLYIPKNKKNLL